MPLSCANRRAAARTAAVDEALGRITDSERAALLTYYDGNTYDQVAEQLGMSRTAVNRKINEGRAKLRRDGKLAQDVKAWDA